MTSSLWTDTTPDPGYPRLDTDTDADVCVIGAGIFGMTTALLLAAEGRSVVVLENDRVARGVTGNTTAKITVLQSTLQQQVESKFGEDGARVYADANRAGLDLIAGWVTEHSIDCDFRRRPAVTYTSEESKASKIEQEAEALQRAGLPAKLVGSVDLPFEVVCAVVLEDQAEFHPRKYVLALARELEKRGGRIFEHSRATDVHDGSPCRVEVDRTHTVRCGEVVVATHYPFLDRGLYFARLSPQRSYAIGVRTSGPVPHGMFISVEQPTRSIRAHALEGEEILIVGGEGHKTGQHDSPTMERYDSLEAWARTNFDVVSVDWRWSAQDPTPAEMVPYVGRYAPTSKHLWVGTGFNKWGFTNGSAAALMVADAILGRENPWLATFNPNRVKPLAGGPKVIMENVNVGKRFVHDRLRGPDVDLGELQPGQGGIAKVDGEKVGVYMREDRTIDAVSLTCTHMGCQLMFNDAEASWDCPCHGSRFDTEGRVIEGPAVRDLERKDVTQRTGS